MVISQAEFLGAVLHRLQCTCGCGKECWAEVGEAPQFTLDPLHATLYNAALRWEAWRRPDTRGLRLLGEAPCGTVASWDGHEMTILQTPAGELLHCTCGHSGRGHDGVHAGLLDAAYRWAEVENE